MDIDALRKQKLADIEQRGRQAATDEILALKQRYSSTQDRTYSFEFKGLQIESVFVTASPKGSLPNSYQIELLTLPETVVEGQCYITDKYGKRIGAGASTREGSRENRVILETLAIVPS